MKQDNIHQIHVNIPKDLYNDIKEIHPDKGMITSVIRRFLIKYVIGMRKLQRGGGVKPSPSDVALAEIITEDLTRR